MNRQALEHYWSLRYKENKIGWDLGQPSTPIKEYINQLDNKEIKILIPGAGNGYEAEYLHNKGFENTYVLDISKAPLNSLKDRVPDFPSDHLLHQNFFEFQGKFDLVLEQTFFCSFEPTPENRTQYGMKMSELIKQNGKLVGLWFNHPLTEEANRPFGGTKKEYLSYLTPYFDPFIFELCYNSNESRQGQEFFGIFQKK